MDRHERRRPLARLAAGVYPQLPRPATLARVAAGAAIIVALVAAVLTVWREPDVERQTAPQPAPRIEVVATDAEHGIRFRLDGRLLTVQMLPDIPDASYETVSGAQVTATCGTPGDPQGETTLTQLWPADQTSRGFRFQRDVSSWCRLEDQSGRAVASVRFPGVPPGTREQITEAADNWVRLFASTAQACNEYTSPTALATRQSTCAQVKRECQREGANCRPTEKEWQWAAEHRGATVQKVAISGDRAAATFSKDGLELNTVPLRRTATGEWLMEFGPSEGLTSPGLLRCTHRRATCG